MNDQVKNFINFVESNYNMDGAHSFQTTFDAVGNTVTFTAGNGSTLTSSVSTLTNFPGTVINDLNAHGIIAVDPKTPVTSTIQIPGVNA